MNLYCAIDEASGEWECNLCGAGNASLDPIHRRKYTHEERLEHYPELQSRHIDFVEDIPLSIGSISNQKVASTMVYVFAIDDTLCSTEIDVKKFLRKVLAAVPSSSRIGIICWGRCLSLLRLCGGISQSVAVDALPGDGDSTLAIDHFISQGVYLTPASIALDEVGRISKTLYRLGKNEAKQSGKIFGGKLFGTDPVASVETIVNTAAALGNVSGNPSLRLFIATGRSIPHIRASLKVAENSESGSLSDGTREARLLSSYAKLGKDVLFPPRKIDSNGGGGCWIDIIRVGFRSVRTDTLEALCGSSGGMIFRSNTLCDNHMLDSVEASLKLGPEHFQYGGTICSLELRCSPGLNISHVIGPVLSKDDSKSIPGLRLDLSTVDIRHLNSESISDAKPSDLAEIRGLKCAETVTVNKKVYKKLYQHNEKNTLVCGLLRLDPNSTVSVQCVPTLSARDQEKVGFQCVIRYARCIPKQSSESTSTDMNQEVIRVMNIELTSTDDKELYLQSLDAELWSLLMARSIVADFHVAQMEYENLRALQFRSRQESDVENSSKFIKMF